MVSIKGRDRTRFLVRRRDNFTCRDCGCVWVIGERQFDVHHLNGLCGKKSTGYDSIKEMDGLITLCHKCHFNRPEHKSKQLSEPNKKHRKWLLLRQRGWTFGDIAQKYNTSRQGVFSAVSRLSTQSKVGACGRAGERV